MPLQHWLVSEIPRFLVSEMAIANVHCRNRTISMQYQDPLNPSQTLTSGRVSTKWAVWLLQHRGFRACRLRGFLNITRVLYWGEGCRETLSYGCKSSGWLEGLSKPEFTGFMKFCFCAFLEKTRIQSLISNRDLLKGVSQHGRKLKGNGKEKLKKIVEIKERISGSWEATTQVGTAGLTGQG